MAKLKSVESFVMKEFRGWTRDLEDALRELEPTVSTEAVISSSREQLTKLIDVMDDPGLFAPQMRAFSVGGAIYIAFYLALAPQGFTAERVWSVAERATQLHFERMSGMEKSLASGAMFGWPMKALSRWLAGKSNDAPVGGWVFDFVEGEGDVAYGVNYRRCAIRELAVSQGAAEFAPYICLSDIVGSNQFGWGLQRSETLAQGGAQCDFRFRRGASTDVKVRLPVSR